MDLESQLLQERQEALARGEELIGSTLLDTYRVEDVLGAGTYGVTLKAQDTMVDQPVAIKWIYRAYRDAMKGESRTLAELSRLPCVPSYRQAREEEGEFYVVMDYIGGGDLGRLIERGGIPVSQALDLSLKLFRALSLVHSKRIGGRWLIHRDIKPANLLMDEDEEVYITDFGAARIVSTTHQSRLSGTGTSGFMAPEISTGRYDQRVDIYSAGMVMYYLFGGQEPAEPEALFYEEPLLSGAQRERLQEIVDKAISESKEARYGSAEEVAGDLEEVMGEVSRPVEQEEEDSALTAEEFIGPKREDVTLDRKVLAETSEESELTEEKDVDVELPRSRREAEQEERGTEATESRRLDLRYVVHIVIVSLGWASGWAVGFGVGYGIHGAIGDIAACIVCGAIGGMVSGLATALVLRSTFIEFGWKRIAIVTSGWTISWAIVFLVVIYSVDEADISYWIASLVGGAIHGIGGGLATALVLRSALKSFGRERVAIVTSGWIIASAMGLLAVFIIGEVAVHTDPAMRAVRFAVGGGIAGAIGMVTVFWQMAKARKPEQLV